MDYSSLRMLWTLGAYEAECLDTSLDTCPSLLCGFLHCTKNVYVYVHCCVCVCVGNGVLQLSTFLSMFGIVDLLKEYLSEP